MSLMIVFVKRTVVCLIALACSVRLTLANPNNYPQFAQQQVDPAIPIFFMVGRVKVQLDAGSPPMLVDVRSVKVQRWTSPGTPSLSH